MKESTIVSLTKAARKAGGDRYEGILKNKDFVIYVPQEVSRQSGIPEDKISVTFESVLE